MALTKENNQLILGAGLLAVAYFGIIRPITNKVGLTTSAKEKALQEVAETASKNQGWNPTILQNLFSNPIRFNKNRRRNNRYCKANKRRFRFFQ